MLLFDGWKVPLKIDSEQGGGSYVVCGNACFNFLGDPQAVRQYIDDHNLNPYFNRHDAVLAHGNRVSTGGDSAIPVYPEVPTTHAVIKDIRERLGMNQAPEVVFSYDRHEALSDDVLRPNPRRDAFRECDVITTNLWTKLTRKGAEGRGDAAGKTDELAQFAGLMGAAKAIYESGDFTDDQDRDFFVVEWESFPVWFVRNEAARLTAMLGISIFARALNLRDDRRITFVGNHDLLKERSEAMTKAKSAS
jgi:hypothetical protein